MENTQKIQYRIKEWDNFTNTFVVEVLDGEYIGLEVAIKNIVEGEEQGTLDIDYDVVTFAKDKTINETIMGDLLHSIINDALEFVYRKTQEEININAEDTTEPRTDNTKQSDNE